MDAYVEAKRLDAEGAPAGSGAGSGSSLDGSVQHDGSFASARERTEARLKAMK